MAGDEVVALVGGGGKTTAMFRLAREVVDGGGREGHGVRISALRSASKRGMGGLLRTRLVRAVGR